MSLYLGNKKVSGLHIGSAAAGTTPIALAKPTINVNANTGVITATVTQSSAGYVNSGSSSNTLALTTKEGTAITPNSTTQTAVAKNVYTLDAVTVKPVPTEEKTVTANGEYTPTSGKYFSKVKVNIDTGIAVNNQANKDVTPSTQTQTVQPDSGYTGLAQVTVNPIPSNYIIPSGNKEITANGTNIPVTTYDTVTVNVGSDINNEPSRTITPTTSKQTITPASGYSGLSQVVVNAMPSGTAGTPTATKGIVSNNSVTITPKVTNTTGYITGSTITGTAVTVTASELVSGNKSITANGTNIDVKNYATVNVAVPASGTTINNQDKTITPTENKQTISADSGYTGLGTVTVNPIPNSYIVPSGTLSISSNGTYDVTNYTSAEVNIATGGSSAITVTDTLDEHGGTIRTITAVDISNDTVTAEHLESGYTAHDRNGNAITGTYAGGASASNNKIASGTWTGSGSFTATVPVGKKMPNTNFVFRMYVPGGTELTYDSVYKFTELTCVITDTMATYDLSSDGTKAPIYTPNMTWSVNNNGTITNLTQPTTGYAKYVRSATTSSVTQNQTTRPSIVRNTTGFSVFYSQGNSNYQFVSGLTYYWDLYYLGNDPGNEIVEIP